MAQDRAQRERGGQGALPRPVPTGRPSHAGDGRRGGDNGSPSSTARPSWAAGRVLPTSSSGAASAGSTRASTPTWTRPTSSSYNTARRCTTRRCWSSATSTPSSSTPTSSTGPNRPTTITLDDLLTPAGIGPLRAVFTDPQHFESPETPESVTQRHRGRLRPDRRPAAWGRLRAASHRPLLDPPAFLSLRRGCRNCCPAAFSPV